MNRNKLLWLSLSLLIIALDQFSKYWIMHHVTYYQPLEIFSWLNFIISFNKGAAFSFLNTAGGWQGWFFGIIAVIVAILIIVWLLRLPKKDHLTAFSLSLILGGALGNLLDRIQHGYVIDFIDFHIKNWHFATFNIADSAICVGAFFMIIKILFFNRRK
jgi:signal peptidase II